MAPAGGASAILAGNPAVSWVHPRNVDHWPDERSGYIPGLPLSIHLETATDRAAARSVAVLDPCGWLDMWCSSGVWFGLRCCHRLTTGEVVNISIDWAALGEVFLVSFAAAVGLIVLFSLGVSSLAATTTEPQRSTQKTTSRTTLIPPVALLCFLSCALIVAYGLYLIIVK